MKNFCKNLLLFACREALAVVLLTLAACNLGGDSEYPGPDIATTALPDGLVRQTYSQSLMTKTGENTFVYIPEGLRHDTRITWALEKDLPLPDGLSLSAAGVISGVPTKPGKYDFIVKATNDLGSGTKALSITIKNPQGSGDPPANPPTPTGTAVITAYYWLNELDELAATPGPLILSKSVDPKSLIITVSGGGYTNQRWFVQGIPEDPSSNDQDTFTFNAVGRANGEYTVGLMVAKDSSYYSVNFFVTVED